MRKSVLLLAAAVVMFSAACTKTGPQGPQGVQGPQGQTGAAGANGVDGTNANVVGSAPFTVTAWSQNGNYYYADFSLATITNSVVNSGIVEVFKKYGTTDWTNLPDISGKTSTVFNFYNGGFSIYVQNSDGTLPAYPGTQTFRTVVITSTQRIANPKTDWKNYKEATIAAGLESAAPVAQ